MPDSDSDIRREWETAEAEWRAATTSAEKSAAEKKFIALEARWREILERKSYYQLTDETHVRAVYDVARQWARLKEIEVGFWWHPRTEPGESYRESRRWDVYMSYRGALENFDNGKWANLVTTINAELRRFAFIDWPRSRDGWTYRAQDMEEGDEPPSRQFTWAVDVWVWDLLDRPQ